MGSVVHAPYPDSYRPVLQSLPGEDYGETVIRYIEEQILTRLLPPDDVAAVLMEPILGEGGYIVPPRGFFPALRDLCDRYGILLIVDEVQSGMGRTGKWWAIQHFDVEPDIVCSAKGIASGVPLGAMIARRSVMTWPEGSHGNTYGGNPLACAAALATIELLEKEYIQNAAEVGEYAMDALAEIQARHESIGDVRGLGLMIGVDFVEAKQTRQPNKALRDRVEKLSFQHGLITLACGHSVIRFAPPLSTSKSEIDEGMQIFEYAINLAENE